MLIIYDAVLVYPGFPKPIPRPCIEALGMRNNLIPVSAVTASSTKSPSEEFAPQLARLHYLGGTGTEGSWSALVNNPNQWLQVDLGDWTRVNGVATQGKQDTDEWVTSYSLSFSYGQFFQFVKTSSGVKKVGVVPLKSFQGLGQDQFYFNSHKYYRDDYFYNWATHISIKATVNTLKRKKQTNNLNSLLLKIDYAKAKQFIDMKFSLNIDLPAIQNIIKG